ncbi:histone mono-ubiquitination 1 isoform X2 [Tasmannia lanceolata]|uniref:histone mono-ubiquitination 1 isoform X2 n=1 Tax=Tasmannia lanceolata TaxID=3420 RepID=UPI004062ED39
MVKLDAAVLQFQNQKLFQQLEAQKAEFFALENKFHQLKEKQHTYDDTLKVVNRSWEQLLKDLESLSIRTRGSTNAGCDVKHPQVFEDDTFLSRLLETGATESCSAKGSPNQLEDDIQSSSATTKNILQNIIASINDLWVVNDRLSDALLETLPEDEFTRQMKRTANNLEMEVKNLRVDLSEVHLKHRSLASEIQSHRDTDAKNKAELKHLIGELENTIAELEDSNHKLASLKAQRASFPVLNLGNKHVAGDKARDKQKDLHDMEFALRELLDLASNRLLELRHVHEERIGILNHLSNLQNTLKDVSHISSSKACLLLSDQIEKSKVEVNRYQALLEKLQVEKDNFIWWEKEVTMKINLADVSRGDSEIAESRISELEKELQRRIDERNLLETKLEEASREPGRKEIIAEFKALVSSLPKDMGIMQSQLNKYKEAALEVHALQSEVRSLSNILDRKANELVTLSGRSADEDAEIQKLQAVVKDLKESEKELTLILEMYRRESTDSRDIIEARDLEFKAWAHVQSLKSSLDEHNLELRVKAANEAEAISQQRLATAEAEIADLRQKLDASGRDISKLSEVLKSKHEEGESYLSEIETIGQAYEDIQTQNQHLLQQITERDDYNIKLVLESVKARQLQDVLYSEKQTMEKEMLQANASLDFYDMKAAQIDEQLRMCSEQVGKLSDDGWQSSVALENTKSRLLDVHKESQHLRQLLDGSQSKVHRSRQNVAELQIELEKERFNKKRIEEELEIARWKATRLTAHREGSSALEKLQQELREYKEILKCSVCRDRQKEVVIAKCFHLFCAICVQKPLESRHRKCPICATSFGHNDVKSIYI